LPKNNFISDLIDAAPNRRSFVRKLGVASAALGAAGARSWGQSASPSPTPTITDIDILNFALNLEYLEAEFYTAATTGAAIGASGITITGTGTGGTTTGGSMVNFTNSQIQAVAMELAHDEQTHVTLLQGAITGLGGQPVAKPAINLAALGIGFGSENDFLTVARALEDVGVTAYGGAAPLITNKSILGYAARILAVEAFHSGNIRLLVAQNSIPTTALDGVDHLPPPSGMLYFNTNTSALSEVRSPGEVLFLAYGGRANATSGGFFPNGVNGNLNTSAASAASSTSDSEFSASPNPIVLNGAAVGGTTITFNAPSSSIRIYAGSLGGYLLYQGPGTGSVQVPPIFASGATTLYLQDASGNKPLTAANTLATLTITAH
jgi:Ferritin-like domain